MQRKRVRSIFASAIDNAPRKSAGEWLQISGWGIWLEIDRRSPYKGDVLMGLAALVKWSLRDGPLRWVLIDVLHSARILVGRQVSE